MKVLVDLLLDINVEEQSLEQEYLALEEHLRGRVETCEALAYYSTPDNPLGVVRVALLIPLDGFYSRSYVDLILEDIFADCDTVVAYDEVGDHEVLEDISALTQFQQHCAEASDDDLSEAQKEAIRENSESDTDYGYEAEEVD